MRALHVSPRNASLPCVQQLMERAHHRAPLLTGCAGGPAWHDLLTCSSLTHIHPPNTHDIRYHAGTRVGEGGATGAGPAASKDKFGENYTGDGREDEINENLATVATGVQRLKIQVRLSTIAAT